MPLSESMLSVIKSNKSIMLDKSKRFRKTLGGYDAKEKSKFNFPEATPQMIKELRLRLIKENKQRRLKQLLLLGVILIGLVIMLILM